jgi:hypothetical protein
MKGVINERDKIIYLSSGIGETTRKTLTEAGWVIKEVPESELVNKLEDAEVSTKSFTDRLKEIEPILKSLNEEEHHKAMTRDEWEEQNNTAHFSRTFGGKKGKKRKFMRKHGKY